MAGETKVLGMKAEVGRWFLVLVGMSIQLCLGAIYAYSVVKGPLQGFLKSKGSEASETLMLYPYVVFLAVFAISMPLAGPFIQKHGPKKVALVGGILTGLGWLLASFSTSPILLILLYGVVGGLGVGIAYGVPVTVSTRWFPDKRGLAVGLTVLGFGFSAFLTGKIVDALGKQPEQIMDTFRYLGVAFIVITAALSLLLSFPPDGWKPAGWNPPAPKAGAAVKVELVRADALNTWSFWGLWLCYTIGSLAGLMAIGITKQVAGEVKMAEATFASLLGVFAICNGGGRPLFGALTDKLGVRNAAVLTYVLIGGASLLLYFSPSETMYIVSFCILWACLGGWLALAPAATAQFFGTKDYAKVYGAMFTAYGAGAVIGSILAGQTKDLLGSFIKVFPIVAALSGLGIVLAFLFLKPPKAEAVGAKSSLGKTFGAVAALVVVAVAVVGIVVKKDPPPKKPAAPPAATAPADPAPAAPPAR